MEDCFIIFINIGSDSTYKHTMSITTLEEHSVSFDAVCEHAGVCP